MLIELESESVSDIRLSELDISLFEETADCLDAVDVILFGDGETVDDELRMLEVVVVAESIERIDRRPKYADAIVLGAEDVALVGGIKQPGDI